MSGLCLLSSQDEFTLYRIHHGLSCFSLFKNHGNVSKTKESTTKTCLKLF